MDVMPWNSKAISNILESVEYTFNFNSFMLTLFPKDFLQS